MFFQILLTDEMLKERKEIFTSKTQKKWTIGSTMEKSPNANIKRKKEIKMDEILQTDVFFFALSCFNFCFNFWGPFFPLLCRQSLRLVTST
jgi:hypothetical protein